VWVGKGRKGCGGAGWVGEDVRGGEVGAFCGAVVRSNAWAVGVSQINKG